jgi:hypothetical protein
LKKSTEAEVPMDTGTDESNLEDDSPKVVTSSSSDIDFEALKSLSQDGIDMSFLDDLQVIDSFFSV